MTPEQAQRFNAFMTDWARLMNKHHVHIETRLAVKRATGEAQTLLIFEPLMDDAGNEISPKFDVIHS